MPTVQTNEIDKSADHPWYGPCDRYGPNGSCSACTGMIERSDGSIIDLSGTVLRKSPLRIRIADAWAVLRRVPKVIAHGRL